jgi:uncharacterized cupin superfamily protein
MKALWGSILMVTTLAGGASAQTHTAIIPLHRDGEPGVGLSGEGNTRSYTFFQTDGNERVAVWESGPSTGAGRPYTIGYTEFVYVLGGSVRLTDTRTGRKDTFRPGEAFVIQRGTNLIWEMDERMREYYIIFDRDVEGAEPPVQNPTFIRLDPNGPNGLVAAEDGRTKSHTYFRGPNRSSVGVWETAPHTAADFSTPQYSEAMFFLSGTVTLTQPDGSAHTFGPGDAVVVPKGATYKWSSDTVRKFWVIFDQEPRSTSAR